MSAAAHQLPRAVIVSRKSMLQLALERHGTLSQAEFYFASRGASIKSMIDAHERQEEALSIVDQQLASNQRRARVDRADLDRFLFAPDDVIISVGQDGLIANVAKYVRGQPVIGINPDRQQFDGVLCRCRPKEAGSAMRWLVGGGEGFVVQRRVMAQAEREDGQRVVALNEVFVGHRSHQSARYRLAHGREQARHSSSGVICSTGTGSTGWARSIAEQRQLDEPLPSPEDDRLIWLAREPFPSVSTTQAMDFGVITRDEPLAIWSEMGEGGVVFADGVETDCMEFVSGQRLTVTISQERLNLVVPRRP